MRTILSTMIAAAVLAACGPSPAKVMETWRPKVDALKAQVAAILDAMPDDGSYVPVALTTKPYSVKKEGTTVQDTNVEIIPFDLMRTGEKPKLDLMLSNNLAIALQWLSEEPSGAGNGDAMTELFQKAVSTPYIGVYNQVRYDRPELKDEKTFKPGGMAVQAAIVELASKSVVAFCNVVALSSPDLDYNTSGYGSFDMTARSDIERKVIDKLAECFAQQTGGQFRFWNYKPGA